MTNVDKHTRTALGSIHMLDLILKTVEADADLSPNQKTWLKTAIMKWKWGLSLEVAFDVSKNRRMAQRNELLKHFAQSLNAMTPWEKAQLILAQVNRMRSGRECSPMIYAANEFHRIPGSRRHIFRIIR